MQESWSPVRAAIDIGSNTIHIVVARATPRALDILADEVDLVRIGESVTANGQISQEKADNALDVLKKYKTLAEQHEAERIFVVATEAIRQASNSAEFLERIADETGLHVEIISGEAEATLTFYGATYEVNAQPHPPGELGVMDLGGGSLELVTAIRQHITWKTSIPIGSGWLHDRYLQSDPPAGSEIEIAQTFLTTYFQGMRLKHVPPILIVTGGSANSLLHLAHRAFRLEMERTVLTHHDLVSCQGLLKALPAQEIAERFEQPPGRVRILLAGAMIIEAMMTRLALSAIHISPHGIREGVLLAYARYGDDWLQSVTREAAQAGKKKAVDLPAFLAPSPAADESNGSGEERAQEEPFAHAGQRMLSERLRKFLEWPDEVLKHEDVEAVHKMRVASRRLRATLDAYQSCCDPKVFKRVYSQVKDAADVLGQARDTDVMLQNLQARLEHTPSEEQAGMRWLIHRLQSYRDDKQRELEDFLSNLDEARLKKQVEACIVKEQVKSGKS